MKHDQRPNTGSVLHVQNISQIPNTSALAGSVLPCGVVGVFLNTAKQSRLHELVFIACGRKGHVARCCRRCTECSRSHSGRAGAACVCPGCAAAEMSSAPAPRLVCCLHSPLPDSCCPSALRSVTRGQALPVPLGCGGCVLKRLVYLQCSPES